MMYESKMALAVKVNNRVLREVKDQVYLPFGSEYSLFLKNLNNRRAVVHIEIDGQNVTHDGLVVNANSSVDLERFITDNLNQGNKFKFIERTAKVEKARGVGVEDGLVRVEFEFEEERKGGFFLSSPIYRGNHNVDAIADTWLKGSTYDPNTITQDFFFPQTNTTLCASASAASDFEPATLDFCDAGITVKGSLSEQKFVKVDIKTDGVKHVMVMKMLGETSDGQTLLKPLTVNDRQIFHVDTGDLPLESVKKYMDEVKEKIRLAQLVQAACTTCKHENSITAKFCSECGTSLRIV